MMLVAPGPWDPFYKNDMLRGPPLMIWGVEKISDANFFFLTEAFLKFFFPLEGLFEFFFSSARPFEIHFFSRKAS